MRRSVRKPGTRADLLETLCGLDGCTTLQGMRENREHRTAIGCVVAEGGGGESRVLVQPRTGRLPPAPPRVQHVECSQQDGRHGCHGDAARQDLLRQRGLHTLHGSSGVELQRSVAGRRMANVDPTPSMLSTDTRQPISSQSERASVSPSPVPP